MAYVETQKINALQLMDALETYLSLVPMALAVQQFVVARLRHFRKTACGQPLFHELMRLYPSYQVLTSIYSPIDLAWQRK